ncbi:flavoprotein hydroxylase [Frankia sp. Hr75.2]|nr:flavoprotein hydroxylase [Frankia sp. Hr75.2]
MRRNHDVDVVIVGYGPVGQVLAILLAQRGWRVTVVERWAEPYPMPRAVSFDGESARIVAACVGPLGSDVGEPSRDYTWKNQHGEVLFHVDVAEVGYCGWPDSTSMYQPGLESALASRGAVLPSLRILRGYNAVKLIDVGDGVELTAVSTDGELRSISASWAVGCDGANSFVRGSMGATVTDLRFSSDWLTCDVVLRQPREFMPNNLQICDPSRPSTAVSAGPGHRRWEFMRLPGESIEELNDIETPWRLLAAHGISPDNSVLVRHAVYTFQALYVNEWRLGNILLAGDAAHLMPPFAGQGMCSGFRDVANLSWKLDLVLRNQADNSLLDTYTTERLTHVQHAIRMSVNLGRVICESNQKAAADRDVVMMATRKRDEGRPRAESAVYQRLSNGVLRSDGRGPGSPAGGLMPQGRVSRRGEVGLFDEIVGRGFVLTATESIRELLDEASLTYLQSLGAHLAWVVAPQTPYSSGPDDDVLVDIDNVYIPYFAEIGSVAVLVRPDFYVFGGARDSSDLISLVGDLRSRLGAPERGAGPARVGLSGRGESL